MSFVLEFTYTESKYSKASNESLSTAKCNGVLPAKSCASKSDSKEPVSIGQQTINDAVNNCYTHFHAAP